MSGNFAGLTSNFAEQLLAIAKVIEARSSRGARRQVFLATLGSFDTHTDEVTDNNPYSPAEETAVADGIVSGVQRLAFPAKFEQAFGYAALVARILIDWTPALGRPADDLDPEGFAVIDQTAITLKDAFCHC